ncbi:50S ribosomal protein L12, putative [Eimeria mitis]|uniref:50S ribosomal protein L12, putative n=1 Tax=Eimeria mitis TaxID=44415 RepID=U6JY92_9EIME|nr:50S ribosomal protein L12, putative [Eimeria mitis]CDJ29022.1 50S ribosomal protein L12, putative [Eimeria mitis]
MFLALSRPQQQRRRSVLMLLALLILSVMSSVCSSNFCFSARRLDKKGAPQAATRALFAASVGAAASARAPTPPSFLTAHRNYPSVEAFSSVRSVSSLCAGGPLVGGGGEGPTPPTGPRVQAALEQLQQLTLLEVSELVRQLERIFGVSAASALGVVAAAKAPPAPAGDQSPGASGESAAPKAPEKTEFKVLMKAVPTASRISVIKTLRSVRSDLGLKEAKNFIDSLPKDVTENINKAEAQKIFDALKSAGAEVEMV